MRSLLFRADASREIGTGHVMRCLALAQAWQDKGGDATFLCAQLPEGLESRLRDEGVKVLRLGAEAGSGDDAVVTARTAGQTGSSWVVVDGYKFGADYQKALKAEGLRLLFMDDYGHADSYSADLVLNQNIYAEEDRYLHREPTTRLLLGARYALLRREFLRWRDWERHIPGAARKVLVTLGGSDPDNITAHVLRALSTVRVKDLEVVAVVGAAYPNLSELQGIAARPSRPFRLAAAVKDMPELMAWADLAISAAGSTCWELLFMGLPAVVIPLADNQEPIARALTDRGVVLPLSGRDVGVLGTVVNGLCRDADNRMRMSSVARDLVDGQGADRVLAHMKVKAVSLRFATPADCERVWHWANDGQARANSFETDPIPWESHKEWFDRKLADAASWILIAMDGDGNPVGQVRFEVEAEAAVISVSVDPTRRGEGLGPEIIRAGAVELLANASVKVIHAYIKPGNDASVRAFRKAGFTVSEDAIIKGGRALHLTMMGT